MNEVWEVEVTDQFRTWWNQLSIDQQESVGTRVDALAEVGPTLGRPMVDRLVGSRHHNMKELRASESGSLRVLLVFDPRRHAILLIGGDKTGSWKAWYRQTIPIADDLYDEYLNELRSEGLI